MKMHMRARTSLALKTYAAIITVIMIAVLVISSITVCVFSLSGAYSDPSGFREKVKDVLLRRESCLVDNYLYSVYWENPAQDGTPMLSEELTAENTNLRFYVTDSNGNMVVANDSSVSAKAEKYTICVEIDRQQYSETRKFLNRDEADAFYQEIDLPSNIIQNSTWETETDDGGNTFYTLTIVWDKVITKEYTVQYWMADPIVVYDTQYMLLQFTDVLLNLRWVLCVVLVSSLLIAILLTVYLFRAVGWRKGRDTPTPNWIDRIPMEIYLGIVAGMAIFLCIGWYFLWEYVENLGQMDAIVFFVIISLLCLLAGSALFLSIILTVVSRIKSKILLRNTVIGRVILLIWRMVKGIFAFIVLLVKSLPLYWKTVFVILPLLALELIVLVIGGFFYPFLIFAVIAMNLLLIPISIYSVIQFNRLYNGAKRLANGDNDYCMNTDGMILEFLAFGNELNGIRDGMQKSVDARMKSEHFKTELITNVSHDIKTPLTSIITYVDLLKKEKIESEAAKEYLAILERQAARLKKLSIDLVEASKASTGNVNVNLDTIDLNLLLAQTTAEFQDRFDEKELYVLTNLTSDQNSMVTADGRLLWRVLDNLMGNICKYSQEKTRVYISTEVNDQFLKLTIKNTSKYPLNISSEELMERFTRGDASRHTEGSGLGLSIARSLVELQKGTLKIVIDGDLFKAIIELPRA